MHTHAERISAHIVQYNLLDRPVLCFIGTVEIFSFCFLGFVLSSTVSKILLSFYWVLLNKYT